MGLTVAELVATLGLDSKDFDRGLDDVNKGFGSLKTAAIGVGVGIAAAIGAGLIKAGVEIARFDDKMNEVFTLLPGISGQAMDGMKDDVKDFAREFGVLPDKVVPALYQSLSAGVPKDNVFEFMETAQKAARGGVTELETAVDGITSVMNAYGADVLGATKASDLMFTAVRLGKTNFEELSASLFNVVPTASSAGVSFGDVTAALASMTAQGTPTSVATTQMRQMLVELTKDGSAAAGTFEKLAGKSFKEFIAAGGNTADALQLLDDGAKKNGKSIADMFGSVEAGQAALALTGKGAKGFRDNLDAMANSAGATQAAYEQMEQGIIPLWNRIKATAATRLLDLGDAIAPSIERGLQAVLDGVDIFESDVIPAIRKVAAFIGPYLGRAFNAAMPYLKDLAGDVAKTVKKMAADVVSVVNFIRANWGTIGPIVTGIWTVVSSIVTTALKIIVGVVKALLAVMRGDWSGAWNAMRGIVSAAWSGINAAVRAALGVLKGIVSGLAGKIVGWVGNLGSTLLQAGRDLIQGLINGVNEKLGPLGDALSSVTNFVRDHKGPPEKDRRLLVPAGKLLMDGLIAGITSQTGALASTLAGLPLGVSPAFSMAGAGGGSGSSPSVIERHYHFGDIYAGDMDPDELIAWAETKAKRESRGV